MERSQNETPRSTEAVAWAAALCMGLAGGPLALMIWAMSLDVRIGGWALAGHALVLVSIGFLWRIQLTAPDFLKSRRYLAIASTALFLMATSVVAVAVFSIASRSPWSAWILGAGLLLLASAFLYRPLWRMRMTQRASD